MLTSLLALLTVDMNQLPKEHTVAGVRHMTEYHTSPSLAPKAAHATHPLYVYNVEDGGI